MPVNSTPVENKIAPENFLLSTLVAKSSSINGPIRGNLLTMKLYNFPFCFIDRTIHKIPIRMTTTNKSPSHASFEFLLFEKANEITTGNPTKKTVDKPANPYKPLAWCTCVLLNPLFLNWEGV